MLSSAARTFACRPTSLVRCIPARSLSAAPQLPPLYADAWDESVAKNADRIALTYAGTQHTTYNYTYAELQERVNRLARGLQQNYGVEPGSTIVSVASNRPEQINLMLACHKLGAVFCPLATDMLEEHTHILVNSYDPSLVIGEVGLRTTSFPKLSGDGHWPTLVLPEFGQQNELTDMETNSEASTANLPNGSSYDEPSMCFSTSGSTGVPKGVIYSGLSCAAVANLVGAGRARGDPVWSVFTPEDAQLLWIPFRGVGATVLTMAFFVEGMRSVMIADKSHGPKEWAYMIENHNITYNILFGASMNEFVQATRQTFPNVKAIGYGGSCYPASLVQQSMKQFPNAIYSQLYGQTEGFPISQLAPEFHDADSKDPEVIHRMTSAGTIAPGAECFIEDVNKVGSGESPEDGIGQICTKTAIMMGGYWKNPAKTAETVLEDGFIRTGDIGKIEGDFLYILDRMKDIIPTHRGYNIAPRDIEEELYKMPDVGQAAVVGIMHPSGAGEQVVAWVTPKTGTALDAKGVMEYLRSSGLPSFQLPDVVEVSETPLPTNGGKIAKKLLRSPSYVRQQLLDTIMSAVEQAESWEDEARFIFQRIDSNANGFIEYDELEAVLGKDKVDAMMMLVDTDHNDFISFVEWTNMLRSLSDEKRQSILATIGSLLASLEREALV